LATYDPEMSIVSVVTGANSGIGRATAIYLAQQGHEVYGTVRSLDKAGKLNQMAADAGVEVQLAVLDVGDDESVRNGMADVLSRAGHVDNLINNAGIGGNSVLEECPVSLYADVMNINLYGSVRCIQAVLPQMRERKSGCIVNISSVVGKIAAIAQQPYFSSKWAVEGMSEGLAQEVAPFGIRVAIVEPGITKSAIFAKNIDAPNQTGAYDAPYRRMFQMYAAGLAEATDPTEVGAVIHHAIHTDEPKLRYPVSWGSQEMIDGRTAMTDQQWVAMGALADDADYYQSFEHHFQKKLA
jgi:NAD(P)-dependent dehydrogenase (short-subunit alcohol dehydrogenase family)